MDPSRRWGDAEKKGAAASKIPASAGMTRRLRGVIHST